MATSNSLWWATPLQTIAALSSAWNSGASSQPSFLSWPMLEHPGVPAQYSGRQAQFMLSRSDKIFPKVNGVSTASNLVLAILAFRSRHSDRAAAAKWPVLLGAFACNVGATLWAVLVMVPLNTEIRECASKLDVDGNDVLAEQRYRAATQKWKLLGVGRVMLMMSAALLGVYSVYLDGLHGLTTSDLLSGGLGSHVTI